MLLSSYHLTVRHYDSVNLSLLQVHTFVEKGLLNLDTSLNKLTYNIDIW